jgi:hypothetical protein
MTWLYNNWTLLVVIVAVAVYFVLSGKASVHHWLLYAVSMAESDLGSGTGRLKLAQVYSDFVSKYPIFSKILPFPVFSLWVDLVLKEMRELIEKNENIASIIKGE